MEARPYSKKIRRSGGKIPSGNSPLFLLALLAFSLRLIVAWRADVYWDEGYLAQIASDLGNGLRPHIDGLWWDGFMPLSASWIAPSTAALFTRLPGLDALFAIRLWACLLAAGSIWPLERLGRALGGPALGWMAAGVFAVAPPAVHLGGLGLYHALGASLLLWAFALAAEQGDAEPSILAWSLGGVAWASCYWLWWVPAVLGFKTLRFSRPRLPWRVLLCGAGPLALVLGAQLWVGGPGARRDFAALLRVAGSSWSWNEIANSLTHYPLVLLGAAGLFIGGRRTLWAGLAVTAATADLLRQRGDLAANAYALVPTLPLLSLGLAAWLVWGWKRGKIASVAAALMLALALFRFDLAPLNALSLPKEEITDLKLFLAVHCDKNNLVMAVPPLNADLREVCRTTDPSQALAAEGLSGGRLPNDLPPEAFVYPTGLESARFLVITWIHPQVLFFDPMKAWLCLRAESEGWPLVLQTRKSGIYANPHFTGGAGPRACILCFKGPYERAASIADARGDTRLAAFARRQELKAGDNF